MSKMGVICFLCCQSGESTGAENSCYRRAKGGIVSLRHLFLLKINSFFLIHRLYFLFSCDDSMKFFQSDL